jgi:hypothetical protein
LPSRLASDPALKPGSLHAHPLHRQAWLESESHSAGDSMHDRHRRPMVRGRPRRRRRRGEQETANERGELGRTGVLAFVDDGAGQRSRGPVVRPRHGTNIALPPPPGGAMCGRLASAEEHERPGDGPTPRFPLDLWCPRTELNRRHEDFQSSALPTELLGRCHCCWRALAPSAGGAFSPGVSAGASGFWEEGAGLVPAGWIGRRLRSGGGARDARRRLWPIGCSCRRTGRRSGGPQGLPR